MPICSAAGLAAGSLAHKDTGGKTAGATSWLAGRHFGELQLQPRAALGAHRYSVFGQVNRGRIASYASRGGIGGFGQWIGRHDSRHRASRQRRHRLEGGPTLRAHVVEATVRRATVEHFTRTAPRTVDFQLPRFHSYFLSRLKNSGSKTAGDFLLNSSTALLSASGFTLPSISVRASSKLFESWV